MKRGSRGIRSFLSAPAVLLLCSLTVGVPSVRGQDSSGLALEIYSGQPELTARYTLGDPIPLSMTIRNTSGWDVTTNRGFSEVELHRSLTVTDPGGNRYPWSEPGWVNDPPPPLFWNSRPTKYAESLPADWARSITIQDLGGLFPMMKKTPGWYTVEAHQPFTRFKWSVQHTQLGLLGVLDDPENWSGNIGSNVIQVLVSTPLGTQPQVRIFGLPGSPLDQVPVRIFRASEIPADFTVEDIWTKVKPVLDGKTGMQGWVDWGVQAPCIPQADYRIFAYYRHAFAETTLDRSAAYWTEDCSAIANRQIVLLQPAFQGSVLAMNSVWVEAGAEVESGGVLVLSDTGPWLREGAEVYIGVGARVKEPIYADSITIANRARVGEVHYNELESKGIIEGEQVTPLVLPVTSLPEFREGTPGSQNITVRNRETKVLPPGRYGNVSLKANSKLRLAGGEYHFRSIDVGAKSSMTCSAPSVIMIAQRMEGGVDSYIGPEPGTSLTARDLVIYVDGRNGNRGGLRAEPKAAVVGIGSAVKANIYAPNGTLWIQAMSTAEGSFIARDVMVGVRARVFFNGFF
jgi:hypothetical protein